MVSSYAYQDTLGEEVTTTDCCGLDNVNVKMHLLWDRQLNNGLKNNILTGRIVSTYIGQYVLY